MKRRKSSKVNNRQDHSYSVGTMSGVVSRTKSGNAFIRNEDGDDIFISRSNLNGAMIGDTVMVDLIPEMFWEKNPEGIVDKIVSRGTRPAVFVLKKHLKESIAEPVDRRRSDPLFIKSGNTGGAKDGDFVICDIVRYPSGRHDAEGIVKEIVAKADSKGGIVKALIRSSGLTEQFPPECEHDAAELAGRLISEEDLKSRKDLREKLIITIDGADAKDLDDAVSVEKLDNGNYILGVHIADVSDYVTQDSALDKEAFQRGNSVYLLSRVIPMLPRSISNGICSLFEGADRLTLTCEMTIDPDGNIIDHEIYKSVINSKARMVYDDVSDMIENGDSDLILQYSDHNGFDVCDTLYTMADLAEILHKKRMSLGSIDFDFDESEIILDEDEIPVDVFAQERRTANLMIEEFMLAANRTVAEHFYHMDVPFIYRVHEKPEAMKIGELSAFLRGFGIRLKTENGSVTPGEISRILDEIADEPYEDVVSHVILRSMTKAYYDTEELGHFGLAFPYYTHFTSPIRRYPDLMIHRIIKRLLEKPVMDNKEKRELSRITAIAAEHSSETERMALDLERDVEKVKKAEYMQQHIGETFDGVISGVAEFGFFVELPNTVEGLVRTVDLMDDYYVLDEQNYSLNGRYTQRAFCLGDEVHIRVTGADPVEKQIDFELEYQIAVSI